MKLALATLCLITFLHVSGGQRVYLWHPRHFSPEWDASSIPAPSKWPPFIWHPGHPRSAPKIHPAKPSNRKEHHSRGGLHHQNEWDAASPIFVAIPIPVPVPSSLIPTPTPTMLATPTPPARGAALGVAAAASGLQTTSNSIVQPARGPISATVTLSGAGAVPIGASSSTTTSGLFPALAAFQAQGAATSPAAQAAAQVVAAAQAAYNAQAAFQAQAAEATRAATQAAYAQQAAQVARNAANTVTNSLGAVGTQLPALPPF
ncbi:uncharacterized protein LOC132199033 [Neocloeon triangulifer]|uniref:uncharacterized protein LOC132199033 n=1 Tax=Neocloeon triangulifer TaxID=2078957 RepID=UPI00286EFB2C|nr:uncharacterized protein LOC132199033 [Neocloeon triangulifer]